MFPSFKAPAPQTLGEDFAAECRHRFNVACQSRKIVPFHKEKRKYADEAWAAVDDYLDWRDINESL